MTEKLSPADELKAKKAAEEKAADAARAEAEQKKAADAEEKRIIAELEKDDNPENVTLGADFSADFADVSEAAKVDHAGRAAAAEEAAKHLRIIAMSYPDTTPNEHTIFGFGGHRFNLGQLRDLFGLRKL